MTNNAIVIAVLFLGAGFAFHAGADASHEQLAQNDAKPAAAASCAWTDGEVRKIDKASGKVTLKHGLIQKLDMPPMTMAYRVKDQAMLEQLKPGDKIEFDVEHTGGAHTALRLEKLKQAFCSRVVASPVSRRA